MKPKSRTTCLPLNLSSIVNTLTSVLKDLTVSWMIFIFSSVTKASTGILCHSNLSFYLSSSSIWWNELMNMKSIVGIVFSTMVELSKEWNVTIFVVRECYCFYYRSYWSYSYFIIVNRMSVEGICMSTRGSSPIFLIVTSYPVSVSVVWISRRDSSYSFLMHNILPLVD